MLQHLLDGVNAAAQPGVAAISMSWGAPETTFATYGYLASYELAFTAARNSGIILLASSGDQGAYNGSHPKSLSVGYPASSPEVIGVGGTTLSVTSAGAYGGEKTWSSSGGGYSVEFVELAEQSGAQISDPNSARGVPDVAFDADPNTGVYVYSSGTWYSVGGTSVGSPNWAAIVADGRAKGTSLDLGILYGAYTNVKADLHDVTSGSNGYYSATSGWDAVTGIGSPNVSNLITNP